MTDFIMNFSKCSILKDKIEMLKYHVCHIKKKKKKEKICYLQLSLRTVILSSKHANLIYEATQFSSYSLIENGDR